MSKINKHIKKLIIAIAVAVVGVLVMILLSRYGAQWFPGLADSMPMIIVLLYVAIFATCMALVVLMLYGIAVDRGVAKAQAKAQQEVEQQSNSAVQDTITEDEQ